MSLLRDHKGKLSMMRIGFANCQVAGTALISAGIYAGMENLDAAATMITAGAGVLSATGFAKAIQASAESKTQ